MAAGGAESEPRAKGKKPGSQGTAIAHRLYPTSENQMLSDQAAATANLNGGETRGYADASLNADMADIDGIAFWNDVQHCEMLLGALGSNLKFCKENVNAEVVAKMAVELEKVTSAVDQMA